MEAAGLPTEQAAAKLSQWQKDQKDFLDKTGLKRQHDRENVEGFGPREAAKAAGQSRAAEKVAQKNQVEYNIKQEEIRRLVRSPEMPKTLNIGNQNKHIRTSHAYKPEEKKSYIYGDLHVAQNLVDKYHGTGEFRFSTKTGKWTNKEFVGTDVDIGVTFDLETSAAKTTNRFVIHYGKKGTHVVPVERRVE